jgi:amidohydrolase
MDKTVLQNTLERHFKWFHQHPEPSNGEKETTARIRSILDEAGIEIGNFDLKTGLVALAGKSTGPVVALRSDIDALPVCEATGLDYASKNTGFMHACGHDFHLSALLGAALLLNEEKGSLAGRVKLIFQPAEEGGGGAQQVIDSGALKDAVEIYGLHTASELDVGVIGLCAGATHAAVGAFKIRIKGKGGHGAAPHKSRDPIVAAAQLINAAQSIVSRNTNPFEQSVLSITHIESGNTWNVIPEEALLEGTFRSFANQQLEKTAKRLEQVCKGIGEASSVEIDFSWTMYTSATNNDPVLTEFVRETAKSLGLRVAPLTPSMGGEDFALYQKTISGVFWTIGVNSPQGAHHPGFIADPAPLSTASVLLAELARKSLTRLVCSNKA